MSFDLVSDLHLHPNHQKRFELIPTSPVLALLGDVCEVSDVSRLKSFFGEINEKWDCILYVLGNHEFYGGDINNTPFQIKKSLECYKNIIVMDNEVVTINDTRFIGSTLWSSMDKRDPMTMAFCQRSIRDYLAIAIVDFEVRQITPDVTVSIFEKNLAFIKEMLEIGADNKNVILTHHAPSTLSVSERFKGSLMNGGFVSNLEDVILDNPSIKVWSHGHTHSFFDYQIGDCRVVCNPLGYLEEYKWKNYQPLKVEV